MGMITLNSHIFLFKLRGSINRYKVCRTGQIILEEPKKMDQRHSVFCIPVLCKIAGYKNKTEYVLYTYSRITYYTKHELVFIPAS
jgi:hypothetical protein